MLDKIKTLSQLGEIASEARRKAIITSCLMTGALGLARISNDEALADEILSTVRAFVKDFGTK